ncbi:MAG: OmpA family protein [Xanthomonadales bacterium]|nr:OmpA family protein [Xanthomonadales bacterium]
MLAVVLLAVLAGCQYLPLAPEEDPEPAPRSEPATVADSEDPDEEKTDQKTSLIATAGIRPLAAGEVGYYMDIQEGRFRQKLAPAGVSVVRTGDSIRLTMPGQLTFDEDSVGLSPAVRPLLSDLAEVLNEYDRTLIALHGFTDDSGPEDYNRVLSERRAKALARFLAEHGVPIERMVIVGKGETAPIASNATEEGRRLNRRVEITVEPVTRSTAAPADERG